MSEEVINEFTEQIIYRLNESTRMVTISFNQLSENDIWKRFNESSNSIGNLILHLCGNITQYAISSLGNKEDKRERDAEFSAQEGFSKKELLYKLTNIVEEAKEVIQDCTYSEWMRKREVQGFNFSGIGIAIHVTEHYSYHTGQIAFWTKQLKNKSLGFYEGIDLNTKNKNN
ncbi:DinB family protein [Aquimarina sp. 2201CG14-23]|uniref:DinB family protein n=1 Tax=Aquimarina mycalae TaxID=3040073 RepID=UPI0024781E21|nr:DinB family protein [Aquimarina sp. 2201CG14-23]MDH7445694.1 DinB family protein [Aquimarina sp. 2201CG14-23]